MNALLFSGLDKAYTSMVLKVAQLTLRRSSTLGTVRIAVAHGSFHRIRQVAPAKYMDDGSFGSREFPPPKRNLDRFRLSAGLTVVTS